MIDCCSIWPLLINILVSSFRVIELIMGDMDINPISTFNTISTKGEQKIKPITKNVL